MTVKGVPQVPRVTRREALRQATHREILTAARRLLADGGPGAVSLRAVATDVGMTAPGLYRYFPSHDDLLLALTDQVVGELVGAIGAATDAAPADEPALRLGAATRAFRSWCLSHQREFQLAFGLAPAPPGNEMPPHCNTDNVRSLCGTFFVLFVELWRKHGFAVAADDSIPPAFADQLRAFVTMTGEDVPLGVAKVYLEAWTRLYGMVAMDVYGHLRFIVTETDVVFETVLTEYITTLLGAGG